GFLVQLAVHGLQRRLVGVHPALRELPTVAAHASGPEYPAVGVHQHDPDVGPVSVRIDHDTDSKNILLPTLPRPARADKRRPAALTSRPLPWKIEGSPRRASRRRPQWLCSSAG